MNIEIERVECATTVPLISPAWTYEDPTEADEPDDSVIVTSKRGLCRVAIVAAEVAGRFAREGSPYDPVAWMLSPRALFGGRAAIESCLARDDFVRAAMLHALRLGLDADPDTIDALLDDADAADDDDAEGGSGDQPGFASATAGGSPVSQGLRLFTATISHADEWGTLHAFHASVAADADAITERLSVRYGVDLARVAKVSAGIAMGDPFADMLVSEAMKEMLGVVEDNPGSPVAAGLDINLEQRFDI